MTTTKKVDQSQGDKSAQTDKKAERNPSLSYTVKSFTGVIRKMKKLKMLTEEEETQLRAIHKNVVAKWVSIGLEL